jgi:hypothetical protein
MCAAFGKRSWEHFPLERSTGVFPHLMDGSVRKLHPYEAEATAAAQTAAALRRDLMAVAQPRRVGTIRCGVFRKSENRARNAPHALSVKNKQVITTGLPDNNSFSAEMV